MRNLFIFLWNNRFFTVFLILEIFSLSLLSSSYSYHRSLSHNFTNNVGGRILSAVSNVSDYFYLSEENKKLLKDNAKLKSQLNSSFLQTDTNIVYRDSLYKYIPANVISNSTSMQNNRIIVNKGYMHGVKKEMGVVTEDGVVGIVIGVSKHYSTIMSALNANTNISAKIKQSGQLVSVSWPGKNYRLGQVTDIPSHIQLQKGDTIVSSGNSIIFPAGIVIGTIEEHEQRSDKDLSIASVLFSVDFNNLHHVYIIKNNMKHEIDSLLNISTNE